MAALAFDALECLPRPALSSHITGSAHAAPGAGWLGRESGAGAQSSSVPGCAARPSRPSPPRGAGGLAGSAALGSSGARSAGAGGRGGEVLRPRAGGRAGGGEASGETSGVCIALPSLSASASASAAPGTGMDARVGRKESAGSRAGSVSVQRLSDLREAAGGGGMAGGAASAPRRSESARGQGLSYHCQFRVKHTSRARAARAPTEEVRAFES